MRPTVRLLSLAALASLVLLVGFVGLPGSAAPGPGPGWTDLPRESAERVVFLGGELEEEELIAFSANLAASGHPGVLLLDAPRLSPFLRTFLSAFKPETIVPIGSFPEGAADLRKRLGTATEPPLPWKGNLPPELAKGLFAKADRVVVSPTSPRRLLLQAASLAGALQAPLLLHHDGNDAELRRAIADWRTQEAYVVGTIKPRLGSPRIIRLADEHTVAASALRHTLARGQVSALVVANAADSRKGMGRMSCLAPYVATQRRAPLLLTNSVGDDAPSIVQSAVKHPKLRAADSLLLLGDLRAIPMEQRANPAAGKDPHIEMEPLTPSGADPFSFATGRLFHPEPGVVALMLARQRLLEREARKAKPDRRKVLVVSNPTGGLPFLEMFSRNTAREFRNRGYQTTALFNDEVTKDKVRRLLPEHDIFLWEGHHSTLVKEYGFLEWDEPLPMSFVFLQSCLALAEPKAHPLLERGAVAVVGSSTRIYSATGGSFALAYFDSLLYDGQTLGGALRHAKNFLLAYSQLKEKRLGKEAKMGGANLRSAWAFTLWGDPTLRLPAPTPPDNALAGVRHEVHGNSITVHLPDTSYEPIKTTHFESQMRPNARLAGLLRLGEEDARQLVPFVFAEVSLPRAPANQLPRLRTRLPDSHWAFIWDARRRSGFLLLTPRPRDQRELRFRIDWEAPAADAQAATSP